MAGKNFLQSVAAASYAKIYPPETFTAELNVNAHTPDTDPLMLYLDERGFTWARCADLVLDPDNAKDHGEGSINSIRKSLRNHGQQKPIVVRRETRTVCAGNGTLIAARAEGWEYIRVSPTDLSGHEFTAYALDDNRTAEEAQWKWDVVSQQLQTMQAEGFDVGSLTFPEYEIAPLLQANWGEAQGQGGQAKNATAANTGSSKATTAKHGNEAEKSTRVLIELTGETLTKFEWALDYLRQAEGQPEYTQAQALDAIISDWYEQNLAALQFEQGQPVEEAAIA